MNSLEKVFREIENLKNIIACEKCDEVRVKFKNLLQDTLEEARGIAEGVGSGIETGIKKTAEGIETGIKKTIDVFRDGEQNQSVDVEEVTENQVQQMANNKNKKFTTEELEEFDGKDGNKAYIAVDGIVYDITANIEFWTKGINSTVIPGRDITRHISSVYGSLCILRGLEIVGILQD